MKKQNTSTKKQNASVEEKKFKTIANCTPREFAEQLGKITNILQPYADNLKTAVPKLESGERNPLDIINYICGDNIDDTMEICGALLFMTGEEFANLDPEKDEIDGVVALAQLTTSKRFVDVITTTLNIKSVFDLITSRMSPKKSEESE